MFHFLRKLAFISPVTLALGFASGCDVSNGTGPGKEQQPDPVLVDIPIAFIARQIPIDDDPDASGTPVSQNILDPAAFHPGAKLIFKDRAKYSATEVNITAGLFPDQLVDPDNEDSQLIPAQIDVKDLESSPNGDKLLFSLRAPADPDDDNPQPTWNLWEYSLETGVATRLFDSVIAEQGQDVSPHYLPDGRIVFSSTRQKRTKAILLDEGKAQYSGLDESAESHAFNLHTFDPRTDEIEQLTFNPSHDLQPTLLANGRIAFLRWDNMPNHGQVSFYSAKPDGSDIQKLYGYNSQTTGPNGSDASFWNAREINDGELLINFRNRESRHWGGDIVVINTNGFTDLNQPNPQNPGSGSPQKPLSLIPINITEDNPEIYSLGGFYNSAYPLNDGTNRLLVSWSPCLINATSENTTYPCTDAFLAKANIQPATPSFGLWVFDLTQGTQKPLKPAKDNEVYTEAIAISTQPRSDNIISNLDNALAEEGVGLIHIRNIYDIDGNINLNVAPMPHLAARSERPERFIRIVKAVPIPDDESLDFDRNIAFGENGNAFMRDILGYVPIEPDGSAKFKIPANMAISLNLVDATGKRLPGGLHENWLSLQPGEHFECVGCHEAGSTQPHGRRDAQERTAYLGAPFIGMELIDQNDMPVSAPQTGQSMAEHFADELEARTPTIDMLYRDIWTQNINNTEADISLAYANIAPDGSDNLPPANNTCSTPAEPVTWTQPSTCQSSANPSPFAQPTWNSGCRITINYEVHIQPLWERDRRTCEDQLNMDGTTTNIVVSDKTCTSCHSDENRDINDIAITPSGSLYLSQAMPIVNVPNDIDPNAVTQNNNCNQNNSEDFYASYLQLLGSRLLLVLVDGELRPVYTSAYEDETNEDGELVLNSDGSVRQRVIRTCFRASNPAIAGNAFNSTGFFSIFEGNDPIHTGILSPSERRLIAEWLDLGGQYYNDPFVAPLND